MILEMFCKGKSPVNGYSDTERKSRVSG